MFIFLVGLPGQLFFGVTSMTLSAVVSLYLWSSLYHAFTGSYFFLDAHIPIAVFLGMHLLFTDPSTSPRSEPGRLLFGALYAGGVIFFGWLLGSLDTYRFYDKLLPVPLLNLTVRAIDRGVRRAIERWPVLDTTRRGPAFGSRARNLAFMGAWALVFGALSATGNLGDAHPAARTPFWMKACRDGIRNGCKQLGTIENNLCRRHHVGWACNELESSSRRTRSAAKARRRSCSSWPAATSSRPAAPTRRD